eukprot:TRINITY_DN22260_c0_g1_i7.p1 TRINITY_DN22260_c0_g1~~TRINITY_DN22260_c0_g1_i7.p1  ORF type:complete len:464 (-),score=118.83 TRINITY_DN22260_c0_g1_i7:187-1578(-)
MDRRLVGLVLLQNHHDFFFHQRRFQEEGRRRRRKALWVHNYLTEERRRESSHYYTLLNVHRLDLEQDVFRNYTRLPLPLFLEILDKVRPSLTRQDTNMRRALEPGLKLAVTLRYLATGDNYRSLSYAFCVGITTISHFLPGVCRALSDAYAEEAFPAEWSEQLWRDNAEKFKTRWNMPHAMGALDGKHVAIKKPKNSGSLYHNYKGFFSIPMLALVDADYKFLWAELGAVGHMSDAQIFLQSDLYRDLQDNGIKRPAPCPLTDDPEDTTPVPYFILSDDAFALKDYCMKPYSRNSMEISELIFNYRLSRARRVVENAFGLLAQRFRVLLGTCELIPQNVREVVECCLTLHNILLQRMPPPANALDREDEEMNVIEGSWREHCIWRDLPQPRPARSNNAGKEVRRTLTDFFGSPPGIVPWQWEKAHVNRPAEAASPAPQPAPASPASPASSPASPASPPASPAQ